jgi:arsenical pump membrane protein
VLLLIAQVRRRAVRPLALVRAASPGFCLFVLALAVVVDEVVRHGLGSLLRTLLPDGTGYLALLGVALVAGLLANVVNNLPATLALVPLVAASPAHVLAVLLGVNIGPNAAYPGSLATLLWRRVVPADARPSAGTFHRVGLTTVVPLTALATAGLWLALRVIGTG